METFYRVVAPCRVRESLRMLAYMMYITGSKK
jgi:hypothetical protein